MNVGKLGRELTTLREARGWTKEEAARRAKLTAKLVGRLERGEASRPAFEDVIQLGMALKLSPSELAAAAGLTGIPPEPPVGVPEDLQAPVRQVVSRLKDLDEARRAYALQDLLRCLDYWEARRVPIDR